LTTLAAPAQRNLFEAVKAACIKAGCGEAAGEEDEEETIEQLEKVDGFTISMFRTLAGLTGRMTVEHTAMVVGFILGLILIWKLLSTASRAGVSLPSRVSSDELAYFDQRIDKLEGEIQQVRGTLDEILILLKERKSEL
jgi:hypothetical protein